MANNLITMGLDYGASKKLISTQLKQIADEISASGTLKVKAQIDMDSSKGLNTKGLKEVQTGIKGISTESVNATKSTQGFFNSMNGGFISTFANMLKFRLIYKVINEVSDSLNQMVEEVEKIDSSLLELSKVSDLTADGLERVTDQAYELGKTVGKTTSQVLDSLTTFKRAGFELEESFKFAQDSLKMVNVSEDINDSAEAAKYLISVMKGYGDTSAEFSKKILDSVNEVSNTQAIDYDNLIRGAQNLSAVANQANVSFEEMLGLITSGYEVLGSESKVSNGLITIFARLQSIQLDGEEEVETTAKLQEDFYNATKGAVSILDQETGQLKSAFDILKDMALVWNDLDANTQSALAEASAGKRQRNTFLSIMQNWDSVEKSIESAQNSMDSAEVENEKYLNSIEGIQQQYKSAFQELSRATVDSDWIKDLTIAATEFVQALTDIVKNDDIVGDSIGAITELIKNLAKGLNTLTDNKGLSTLLKFFIMFEGGKFGINIVKVMSGVTDNIKKLSGVSDSLIGFGKESLDSVKESNTTVEIHSNMNVVKVA